MNSTNDQAPLPGCSVMADELLQ